MPPVVPQVARPDTSLAMCAQREEEVKVVVGAREREGFRWPNRPEGHWALTTAPYNCSTLQRVTSHSQEHLHRIEPSREIEGERERSMDRHFTAHLAIFEQPRREQ